MKPWSTSSLLLLSICSSLAASPLYAQNTAPADIHACTGINNNAQRLACYDHAAGRNNMPTTQKQNVPTAPSSNGVFQHEHSVATEEKPASNAVPLSLLDSRWELSPQSKLGTFNLRGYKPIYVLPFFATSHQNNLPGSPNPTIQNTHRSACRPLKANFSSA